MFLKGYIRGKHILFRVSLPLHNETTVASALNTAFSSEVPTSTSVFWDGVRWWLILSKLAQLSSPWVLEVSSVPLISLHRMSMFLIVHSNHAHHFLKLVPFFTTLKAHESTFYWTNWSDFFFLKDLYTCWSLCLECCSSRLHPRIMQVTAGMSPPPGPT